MARTDSDSTRSASGRRDPLLAVIGCGAITELYHLPALVSNDATAGVVLVDSNRERAEQLGAQFGTSRVATDFREVMDEIDGAIVATPPNSHHQICNELMEGGVPVLCEKPLASSAAEAKAMVERSAATGAALCVNQTRRLYQSNMKVKQLIADGTLGEIESIEYVDGDVFNWPTASGFYFEPGARGVLSDRGIHSLDLICWWLDSKPDLARAQTDSFGGPESVALIELAAGDCRVDLKLSWLTSLANTFTVKGSRASVSGGIADWRHLELTEASGKTSRLKLESDEVAYNDFGRRMMGNFIDVVNGDAEPAVPAASVVPAIELIDEAYNRATRIDLPWLFDGAMSS